MTHKISSDGAAAVALDVYWLPVGPDTPRGVGLWLINQSSGVSIKGQYSPTDKFPTHWFPNPKFKK